MDPLAFTAPDHRSDPAQPLDPQPPYCTPAPPPCPSAHPIPDHVGTPPTQDRPGAALDLAMRAGAAAGRSTQARATAAPPGNRRRLARQTPPGAAERIALRGAAPRGFRACALCPAGAARFVGSRSRDGRVAPGITLWMLCVERRACRAAWHAPATAPPLPSAPGTSKGLCACIAHRHGAPSAQPALLPAAPPFGLLKRRLPARLPACLPACPPACLPACLPARPPTQPLAAAAAARSQGMRPTPGVCAACRAQQMRTL
jgi:hypothetical protein